MFCNGIYNKNLDCLTGAGALSYC